MSAIERDVRDVEFLFDHKLVDLVVNPTNNALEAVVLQKQVRLVGNFRACLEKK